MKITNFIILFASSILFILACNIQENKESKIVLFSKNFWLQILLILFGIILVTLIE